MLPSRGNFITKYIKSFVDSFFVFRRLLSLGLLDLPQSSEQICLKTER